MRFYYFEMVGTAVFAITGVLAVTRRGLDVFGALVLGIVTALGGGTVRDLIIGAPPFWINDFNYVWAAGAGALAAFSIGSFFRDTYRGLRMPLGSASRLSLASVPSPSIGTSRCRHGSRIGTIRPSKQRQDFRFETRRFRLNERAHSAAQSKPRFPASCLL